MKFSVEALTALKDIKAGGKVHVIGVCGVAMAQIALQLLKNGFEVSGSDKEFFEPMSSLLKSSSIKCLQGYDKNHISKDLDLVVIGNSVSANNPEVLAVEELGLSYSIFPKLLYDLTILGRHSVVISGTHGKTTSSAMLSYVYETLKKDPSYFIGGRVRQLDSGLKAGANFVSVVEGDEYDSAFFAKFAKFHFYKPDTLIITSIEFDHADIYADLNAIKQQFLKLVADMPADGLVIACIDDQGVRELLPRLKRIKTVTYGESPEADVRITFESNQKSLTAKFRIEADKICELSLGIPGRYNLKNAVACALALQSTGVAFNSEVAEAFASFAGVDRRQQVWLKEPVTLIEDFAHHPTAVRETLRGIREWLPGRRLIAIFEPRSNTSRKKIFQDDYVQAFAEADLIVMKEVEQRSIDTSSDLFDVKIVCQQISATGKKAESITETSEIEKWLLNNAKVGDIVLVMSNGSFGGLIGKLAESLKSIK